MKGFIKRRPFVKMVALFLCLALCIQGVSTNLKTANAASEAKYDGDYNISTILSRYQYFIQNDVTLNSSGHTVGAVVVGGTLDLANTFGDAAIVPSYIHSLKAGYLGNGWSGKYPLKSETIYYVEGTENLYDWQISNYDWIQVGEDYISMTDAFSQIKAQSKSLTEGATKLTAKDGTITIDCTADKDVTYEIDYSDFASNNVNIIVNDVDWFKTNLCIINVTGVGANKLTFDGYWPVHVNGSTSMDSALEKMSGSDEYFNQQLNVNGMNLIWNFPDATGTLNIQGLGGHLIAPSATVNFNSGNYEGGVIAKELTGGAQGHFYPMSRTLGTVDTDETEAGTADITISKLDENGNALSGAEISLWYKGDGSLKDVTSTSGHKLSINTSSNNNNNNIVWKTTSTPCVLNNLPNGEYSITETVSPTGYKFADSISFKVADGKIYLKLANGSYSSTALEDNKFSMTDEAKTGSLTLTGSVDVKVTGAENAPDETYYFVVTENGNTVATGQSNSDGTITFTEIKYTKDDIGTHEYKITQTSGDTTNMTYDDDSVTVEVKVSDVKTVTNKETNEITEVPDLTVEETSTITISFTNEYKTVTPSPTPTNTPTPTATNTPTPTATNTPTPTATNTPTPTATTAPAEPTATTAPAEPTATKAPAEPTATKAPAEPTATNTPTPTATNTPTPTATNTPTPTATNTPTPTATNTPTPTATNTPTPTATNTPTPSKGADVTEPTPSQGADVTEPTPSQGADVTEPTPSQGADVTEPTPSQGADVTEPTPSQGADVTEPTPSQGADVTEPTPSQGADVTEPTPTQGEDNGEDNSMPGAVTGGLTILVVDEETGDVVPGAKVDVTDPTGTTTEYVTDEKGLITITETSIGLYELVTTEVPDGYTVTVGETETAEVKAGETTEHIIKIVTNSLTGEGQDGTNPDLIASGSTVSDSSSDSNSSNGSPSTGTVSDADTPKTGDSFTILLYAVMLLSAGTAGFIIVNRKKLYKK